MAGVLILALVAAVAVGAKPKQQRLHYIPCDSLIKPESLEEAIAKETGTAPEMQDPSSEKVRPGYALFNESPATAPTDCQLHWSGEEEFGNAPAFGWSHQGAAVPTVWYVYTHVSAKQFRLVHKKEDTEDRDLPFINAGFSSKSISLGSGSEAFAGMIPVEQFELTPTYPTDYGLYVRSKRGNVLELWAWPLSLDHELEIVKNLLIRKKF